MSTTETINSQSSKKQPIKQKTREETLRIEEDKRGIRKLLSDLEDKLEDKPLTRAHNSVSDSFKRILDHIDKLSTPEIPASISGNARNRRY